jgi:hypothetical protein
MGPEFRAILGNSIWLHTRLCAGDKFLLVRRVSLYNQSTRQTRKNKLLSTQQESFAEDIYRINNRNSLVTASHEDLATFMALNARHMTQAVRDM